MLYLLPANLELSKYQKSFTMSIISDTTENINLSIDKAGLTFIPIIPVVANTRKDIIISVNNTNKTYQITAQKGVETSISSVAILPQCVPIEIQTAKSELIDVLESIIPLEGFEKYKYDENLYLDDSTNFNKIDDRTFNLALVSSNRGNIPSSITIHYQLQIVYKRNAAPGDYGDILESLDKTHWSPGIIYVDGSNMGVVTDGKTSIAFYEVFMELEKYRS